MRALRVNERMLIAGLAAALGCSSAGNHGPELFPIGNKNVETGATLEFEVTAVDDDGDDLEFRQQWSPTPAAPGAVFMKIDRNSARFLWTPIASDAGPDGAGIEYQVTFTAHDGTDSDTETITVFVTLGGAGAGAPVFITPSDHVLDLDRSDHLGFKIEVRDPDSAEVDLSLVEGIEGGEFTSTPGSKTARFYWQPTEQQAAERPVWSLRIKADDRRNPSVFQDITILLKGGQKKCEGTPPMLDHVPLPDQRGDGDYTVLVTATDAESRVAAVDLHWKLDRGDGGAASVQTVSMTPVQEFTWQGRIPNPGLAAGGTAAVTYYICAQDDDDASGTECDLRACTPEDGGYSFTAYPAGSTECVNDELEGNDSAGAATEVEPGLDGERYYDWLRICPGDEDWFLVEVSASHRIEALLLYSGVNGALTMDLLDEEGGTVLVEGEASLGEVVLGSDVFVEDRRVTVRVRGGGADVEGGYDLLLAVEQVVPCEPDGHEPNDAPADAGAVAEGEHTGLTCCGDPDFYTIELLQGDTLEVKLDFAHAQGDLDLWIFDEATATGTSALDCSSSLGCGISETDDESVVVPLLDAGTYYIAVAPYEGARNSYDMSVIVTPASEECIDDAFDTGGESNGTPGEATALLGDESFADLELCPGDEDWFRTDLDVGEILLAEISFTHADGDLDFKLYRDGVGPGHLQDHLLDHGMTRSDNEELEWTADEAGTVFLRVMGYGGAGNTYGMTVLVGR